MRDNLRVNVACLSEYDDLRITALVIQNSVTMNTLLGYQSRVSTIRRQVRGAMEIAVFIQNIQEERAEVALYIFTNQSIAATAAQREANR